MPTTGFELPFGITIDLSFWQWFTLQNSNEQTKIIFVIFGWAILAAILFYMGAILWIEYRQNVKFAHNWKWVLLAVDVPPLYMQTPKAVEQIFAHLSGAKTSPNVGEKFWKGKKQKWFSFEIVSIEGYIQFLIYTESEFRDLIEAAIYAQYADAEITEVEDYAKDIPTHYPNSEYDVMGVEFKLASPEVYPIRTYPSFEYNISKDLVFSDPMAAILENFSRIGHGENLWLQLIVEPADSKWKQKGIDLVRKVMGKKPERASGLSAKLLGVPQALMQEVQNIWYWKFEPDEHKAGGDTSADVNKLSPGTKNTLEAIEEKISKIGFYSKLRVLYAARKDVYNPTSCLDGIVGAMNQFHMQDRNAIVPFAKTKAHYDWKDRKTNRRKTKFVYRFKTRKPKAGTTPYILNIEELATVWHFPLPFVKTPLMQKAGAKRAEPPNELPVELSEVPLRRRMALVSNVPPPAPELPPETPPEDLPYG